MRFQGALTTALFIFIVLATCPNGESQTPSAGLEKVHVQRGVTCEQCHGKSQQDPVPMEPCLGCHGNYQKLAESSKGRSPNVHDSHLGEIRCTLCHHEHKASEMYCNRCHNFDMKVP